MSVSFSKGLTDTFWMFSIAPLPWEALQQWWRLTWFHPRPPYPGALPAQQGPVGTTARFLDVWTRAFKIKCKCREFSTDRFYKSSKEPDRIPSWLLIFGQTTPAIKPAFHGLVGDASTSLCHFQSNMLSHQIIPLRTLTPQHHPQTPDHVPGPIFKNDSDMAQVLTMRLTFAAGCSISSSFKIVAPSFVIVTSPMSSTSIWIPSITVKGWFSCYRRSLHYIFSFFWQPSASNILNLKPWTAGGWKPSWPQMNSRHETSQCRHGKWNQTLGTPMKVNLVPLHSEILRCSSRCTACFEFSID